MTAQFITMTNSLKTQKVNVEELTQVLSINTGEMLQEVDESARKKFRAHVESEPEVKHMSVSTYRLHSRRRYGALGRLDLYLEDVDPRAVYEDQAGLCGLCFTPLGNGYQLDHIRPVAAGGKHCADNIRAVHPGCNQAKVSLDVYVGKIWQQQAAIMQPHVGRDIKLELDQFIAEQFKDWLA